MRGLNRNGNKHCVLAFRPTTIYTKVKVLIEIEIYAAMAELKVANMFGEMGIVGVFMKVPRKIHTSSCTKITKQSNIPGLDYLPMSELDKLFDQ